MTDTQKLERLDYLSNLPYSKHTSEDWDEELALECELQDHTFYLVIGHEVNEDGEFSLVQKTFASSEKLNREKLASMFYVYHAKAVAMERGIYEIDSDSMNWTDDQYIEYMEQDCAINLTVDKVYESEKVIVLKEVT